MKYSLQFFIVFVFTFCLCEDQLKFAVVFLRHGARSARSPIKEIQQRLSWPNGPDELTPSGQRQLHLLGKMMRKYFIDDTKLLPEFYDTNAITARASNHHRTIMSAHSFLLGMYPELNETLNDDQLRTESNWTPPITLTIPDYIKNGLKKSATPYNVPTIPLIDFGNKADKLLSFGSCDKFYWDRMEFYKTERFMEVHKRYNDTFQKACKLLGIACENIHQRPVWEYVDTILTSEFDGQLPELSEFPELVEELEKFYTESEYCELTHEPELQTPVAMYEFSKVIPEYFDNAFKTPEKSPKMIILSTHESTMLSYLIAFGVKREGNYETVPYSSNMIFEMRQKAGSDPKDINSYYINTTFNSKKLLEIMNLKNFTSWLSNMGKLPGNLEEICVAPKNKLVTVEQAESSTSSFSRIITALAILLVLGTVVAALHFLTSPGLKNPYKKDEEYEMESVSIRNV